MDKMQDRKAMREQLDDISTKLTEATEQLDEFIEGIEDNYYHDVDTLSKAQVFTEEENLGLPLPRLEIRTSLLDNGIIAVYFLVTRHFLKYISATPISWTSVSGHYQVNEPHESHRDSHHIRHDMKELNLPGYFVNSESGKIKAIDLSVEL